MCDVSFLTYCFIFAADRYLALNTPDAMNKRAAIITTWLAVGRSGEVAFSNYGNTYWDHDEKFVYFDWNEKKVAKQKPMTFVSDAESYSVDFYHSMACHYIVGGQYNIIVPFYSRIKYIYHVSQAVRRPTLAMETGCFHFSRH